MKRAVNHILSMLAVAMLVTLIGFTTQASAQQQGQIIGKVKYQGPSTETPELIVSAKGGVQNVVITVEGVEGDFINDPVEIDQKNKTYVPRISATMVGNHIAFTNSDAILHNVHAYLNGRPFFNVAMPKLNQRTEKRPRRPGLVAVKCDVHSEMRAYVVVTDNPFYAVTNAAGLFLIDALPAGTYTVKAWHETLGTLEQEITIEPGKKAPVVFEFQPSTAS